MTCLPNLILVVVVIFILYLIFNYQPQRLRFDQPTINQGFLNREPFAIQYGLPPSTSDADHGHIKNLITLGSQSNANKKYDVVSTEYLGDISEPAPPEPPPPPPDPICFAND
jgi:hypothetical protein